MLHLYDFIFYFLKMTQIYRKFIISYFINIIKTGSTYSCENGKMGSHRNKMMLSAVCGIDGGTVIGTSEGDLLLFQGA